MGVFTRVGGFGFGGGVVEPNGSPSSLVATVLSDTSIKCDWTIGSTNQDGHKVFISTNGTDFTEATVTWNDSDTFTITGLTYATTYYLYVVAYKGSKLSLPTDTVVITTTGTDKLTADYIAYVESQGGTAASSAIIKAEYTDMIAKGEMTQLGENLRAVINYGIWGYKLVGGAEPTRLSHLWSLVKVDGAYPLMTPNVVTPSSGLVLQDGRIKWISSASSGVANSYLKTAFGLQSFYIEWKNAKVSSTDANMFAVFDTIYRLRLNAGTTGRFRTRVPLPDTYTDNYYFTNSGGTPLDNQTYKIRLDRKNPSGTERVNPKVYRNGLLFYEFTERDWAESMTQVVGSMSAGTGEILIDAIKFATQTADPSGVEVDIRTYGASTTATPYENTTAYQAALAAGDIINFGLAGETYLFSQPIKPTSGKTLKIYSTVKIMNGYTANLSADVIAGSSTITLDDATNFNFGEGVVIYDDNCPTYSDYGNMPRSWAGTIIEKNGNTLTLDTTFSLDTAFVSSYTVAANAVCKHSQCTILVDQKSNVSIVGTGTIDNNSANQAITSPSAASLVPENWRVSNTISVLSCQNFTIKNVTIINGSLHNLAVNGISSGNLSRYITVENVTCTAAKLKNHLYRYVDNATLTNITGTNSVYEDGVILYLGCTNFTINGVTVSGNTRFGFAQLSACSGNTLTGMTASNNGVDMQLSSSGTFSNITATRPITITAQYATDNITINNLAVTGCTATQIVWLMGNIKNVTFNEFTMTNCNGIGIKANDLNTPGLFPDNVVFNGGGIYTHTGTKTSISVGSDVTFTDFDGLP